MWSRIVLCLAIVCALARAELKPETFGPAFEHELAHHESVAPETTARAAQFEYVFVGGFLGDYLGRVGGFAPIRKELAALGVPESQFHAILPPSKNTVEKNASEFLPERINDIARATTRKLVLIAHSKGCPELFSFALEHPDLIESRVEGIFFIQGAFGGSPLADLVVTKPLPPIPAKVRGRVGMRTIRRIARMLYPFIQGVKSLTTSEALRRQEGWLRRHAPALERLKDRLLFVRSWTEPEDATYRLRIGARYLEVITGKRSDGVVPFDSQRIAGMGASEVVLNGIDHSLPCSWFLSGLGPERARALIRAIAASVGHPAPVEAVVR